MPDAEGVVGGRGDEEQVGVGAYFCHADILLLQTDALSHTVFLLDVLLRPHYQVVVPSRRADQVVLEIHFDRVDFSLMRNYLPFPLPMERVLGEFPLRSPDQEPVEQLGCSTHFLL